MCLICIEWEKGNLTTEEALRAFRETLLVNGKYNTDSEHADHSLEMLSSQEKQEDRSTKK